MAPSLRLLSPIALLLVLIAPLSHGKDTPFLNNEEQTWLATHPHLRIGVDPDWAPFEFIDADGVYRGLGADYTDQLRHKLGIALSVVPNLSWTQVLEAARNRDLDVVPAVTPTPQRRQYLNFTRPYLSFPLVLITRLDTPSLGGLENLGRQRIAVVRNYYSHETLATEHRHLTLLPMDTIEDALNAVATGRADVFAGNLASASYAINNLGLTGLKVNVTTDYQFRLAIGVRKDWPELVGILNKALQQVDDTTATKIRSRWVQLNVLQQGIDPTKAFMVLGPIVSAVLAAMLVILIWNRRLHREVRERRAVERELRRSQHALLASQSMAHIGSWVWELSDDSLLWSDETFALVGRVPAQGAPSFDQFLALIHDHDRPAVESRLRQAVDDCAAFNLECRIRHIDGQWRTTAFQGEAICDKQGRAQQVMGVIHDITAKKEAETKLLEKQRTLQLLLDNAPIGIWLQNAEGRLLFVNNAFCEAIGVSEERFLAVPHYAQLYPEEIAASCVASDAEALASDGPHVSYEKVPFVDGQLHDLEVIKVRLNDNKGQASGLIGLSMDVTARKQAETKLRQRAYFDELTGLPNRTMLMEQLARAVAQTARHGTWGALLFLDLDNFKVINDSLGHQAGDELLVQLAERLSRQLRQEDIAGRLGGDEFVVLLTDLGADKDCAARDVQVVAEKIRDSFNEPFQLHGHPYHVTPSIGISLFPGPNQSAEEVLKHADTAMYRAKEAGRNAIRFFLPSMQRAAEDRLLLQNSLRAALHSREFQLHFQPQVGADGEVLGAEALIRWYPLHREPISPAAFIPVAEESSLILPIGTWVLREACRHMMQWRAVHGAEIRIGVNVSPRQFHQSDFVAQVEKILRQTGADPRQLELELTEGILLNNVEEVGDKMRALKQLGVGFSIDDFGTGYSSLAYLKRLPVDRIKIDQSFVRDITSDPTDALIVETIISMTRQLGLENIAEGVETEAQYRFLAACGCNSHQGYLFSHPLAEHAFIDYLLHRSPRQRMPQPVGSS